MYAAPSPPLVGGGGNWASKNISKNICHKTVENSFGLKRSNNRVAQYGLGKHWEMQAKEVGRTTCCFTLGLHSNKICNLTRKQTSWVIGNEDVLLDRMAFWPAIFPRSVKNFFLMLRSCTRGQRVKHTNRQGNLDDRLNNQIAAAQSSNVTRSCDPCTDVSCLLVSSGFVRFALWRRKKWATPGMNVLNKKQQKLSFFGWSEKQAVFVVHGVSILCVQLCSISKYQWRQTSGNGKILNSLLNPGGWVGGAHGQMLTFAKIFESRAFVHKNQSANNHVSPVTRERNRLKTNTCCWKRSCLLSEGWFQIAAPTGLAGLWATQKGLILEIFLCSFYCAELPPPPV